MHHPSHLHSGTANWWYPAGADKFELGMASLAAASAQLGSPVPTNPDSALRLLGESGPAGRHVLRASSKLPGGDPYRSKNLPLPLHQPWAATPILKGPSATTLHVIIVRFLRDRAARAEPPGWRDAISLKPD